MRNENEIRQLCDLIRQTAYELHAYLGIGFIEKVYENALKHRLEKKGLSVRQQAPIDVFDEDGYKIGFYEADLLVEGKVIVELKAVTHLAEAHVAQLVNYLKATSIQDGLLINFGSEKFQILKRVFTSQRSAFTADAGSAKGAEGSKGTKDSRKS